MTGMLRARGDLIGFFDAGSDIDTAVWSAALAAQRESDADVVAGSKRHPESVVSCPVIRRIYSGGYQILTRLLFRVSLRDTQTGMKLFKAEVLRRTSPLLVVNGFAFDIELVALARHFGFTRISEVPVTIEHDFNSSVNVRHVFRMLWDTLGVFYWLRIIRYYDRIDEAEARQRVLDRSPAKRAS